MIEKMPSYPLNKGMQCNVSHHPYLGIRHLALCATVVAVLGLFGQEANALALGRIAVQSALGEVLNAQIDVPDINPDEAGSLRATIGSVEAFRKAGLEYNPAISGLRVAVQRRPDGRVYLRLSSDRIINEPFLDVVIEANWATGQLTRDYTLLFDPVPTRPTQITPTAPQIAPSARTARSAAQETAPALSTIATPIAPTAPLASTRSPAKAEKPKPQTPATEPTSQQIKVRAGDTASKIATAIKPASISLDQMLVALLQANPNAFTGANVNRLKAGVVLDVPSAQAASGTTTNEASKMVLAQSRDFNDFRRKLASGSAVTAVDAGKRSASGKVQAQIEDKKASNALPDKLSLHKGEMVGKANAAKLAASMQAKEAANRLAELNKNINELQKLSGDASKPAGSAAAPAKVASAPSIPIPVAGPKAITAVAAPAVVASAPAAVVSAPVTLAASAPVSASLSAPASVPVTATPTEATVTATTATVASPSLPASATTSVAAPAQSASATASAPVSNAPQAEPSFLADLMENQSTGYAVGGLTSLFAALGGLALYRRLQRKKTGQIDSTFTESRLQPDSFFGTSGGGKIDTNEAAMAASSMMYSPSQIDAGADVDPVAEADVYLAYGRDLQAEEILKEALRANPGRAAIHFKLLQIYAKRRDILSYAATATEAQKLTHSLGSEWGQACDTGRELDPTNPLYHSDGLSNFGGLHMPPAEPEFTHGVTPDSTFSTTNIFPHSQIEQDELAQLELKKQGGNVDLDLDFSDAEHDMLSAPTTEPKAEPTGLPDLNFELDTPPVVELTPAAPATAPNPDPYGSLEFTTDDLPDLDEPPAVSPPPPPADDFHLDALSLDLDVPTSPSAQSDPVLSGFGDAGESTAGGFGEDEPVGDPLITKLALAEEFQAIGDDDGARTLAQEVADEATGSLKEKALQFLAELG